MTGDEFYDTVALAVKRRMADERLTLRSIEEQTGVGHSTVARAITGRDVKLNSLLTLAKWAGLTVYLIPSGPTFKDTTDAAMRPMYGVVDGLRNRLDELDRPR